MIKVIFFGDSVCVGQGVSLHDGWVTRVSRALHKFSTELGVDVLVSNSSGNGRTTRQALEVMPYEVQYYRPDLLIVQFGLNDSNCWDTDLGLSRVSLGAFKANLQEIAVRGARFGVTKILMNTNHPTRKATHYEERNRNYNLAIREVVEEERLILGETEHAFLNRTGGDRSKLSRFLLADGLHLNEEGHDLYFNVLYPIIKSNIRELAQEETRRKVARALQDEG